MKNIILILSLLSLAGCATIFSGKTQTVNIKSVDVANNELLTDIQCTVRESNGAVKAVSGNPGAVSVTRGDGALDVICKKDGYKQLNTMVGDSFNGTTFVNILFWPGFLVDAATGAYKQYPSHYVVSMEKIPAGQAVSK